MRKRKLFVKRMEKGNVSSIISVIISFVLLRTFMRNECRYEFPRQNPITFTVMGEEGNSLNPSYSFLDVTTGGHSLSLKKKIRGADAVYVRSCKEIAKKIGWIEEKEPINW